MSSELLPPKDAYQTDESHNFCEAFANPRAIEYLINHLQERYGRVFASHAKLARELAESAMWQLHQSQSQGLDQSVLLEVSQKIFQEAMQVPWFKREYQRYKQHKDTIDASYVLRAYPDMKTLLDIGCGANLVPKVATERGIVAFGTDIINTVSPTAAEVPFRLMSRPDELPFQRNSFDVGLIKVSLHHVNSEHLLPLLQDAARVCNQLVVIEDVAAVEDATAAEELRHRQPLAEEFLDLTESDRRAVLLLLDYYGNMVVQGLKEMNMPFNFKSDLDWKSVLETAGWEVKQLDYLGFVPWHIHTSCLVALHAQSTLLTAK